MDSTTTMRSLIPTHGISTATPRPSSGSCLEEILKCYDNIYKAMGIDLSDGLSVEEQRKMQDFASQIASGPSGICP